MTRENPRGSMIGRDAELARLLRLVDDEARLVLIAGDPGVGKTMLVEQFVARLDPAIEVLRAYATPSSIDRPHDVVRSATADRVSSWPEVPSSLAGRSAAVVHLVGPVAPKLTGSGASGPDEVAWVGAELLHHLAGDAPLVLVVDDLQWADAESLDIIDRLLMHERRSLVVSTHRPGSLGHNSHVGAWISRMDRRQPVAHLRVAPLDLASTTALVADLAGREPDARAARNLWARTGGNPFFVSELVRCQPDALSSSFEEVTLPVNVAAMVADQLSSLDQPTRCTLDYLAVLGQEVRFDELLAVAGETERELAKQLQRLIDANLILEVGNDQFAFRHALLREAVHDSVMSRERRQMHNDALEWVLQNDGPPTLILHHALGAGRHDLVVDSAKVAATEAFDAGSSFRALMLAETGLDEAPDDPELLRIAARASWHISQPREAAAYAKTLLDIATTNRYRADALRLLVRLDWEMGQTGTGQARRAELGAIVGSSGGDDAPLSHRAALVELLDDLEDADRAVALADLAQASMLRTELHEAVRLADEAIELAERIGDRRVAAQARVERASASAMLADRLDTAAAEMEVALDEVRSVGDWIAFCRGINNLVHSTASFSAEREDELSSEMRRVIQRLGAPELLCIKHDFIDIRASMRKGDLDGLLDSAALQRSDRPHWLKIRAPLLLEAGQWQEVLDGTDPVDFHENLAALLRSLALGLAGRSVEADALLGEIFAQGNEAPVPVLDDDTHHDHAPYLLLSYVPLFEIAGLDTTGIGQSLVRMRDHIELPDIAARVDGWLAQQDERWAQASDHHRTAIGLLEKEGNRQSATTRSSLHVDLARTLIELDRPDEARVELKIAERLLRSWGEPRKAQVAALLKLVQEKSYVADEATGSSEPASSTADELTPREAEVAALVAQGLTNGEIGEQLFIARKTVSVHVSNMLAKLTLANRTELAAWLVRRDAQNQQ